MRTDTPKILPIFDVLDPGGVNPSEEWGDLDPKTDQEPQATADRHTDLAHDWRLFECGHCGKPSWKPESCGNRFCDICQGHRHARAYRRLKLLCSQVTPLHSRRLKFITLTMQNSYSIKAGVKVLRDSFRKLRQSKWWKHHVDGGVFVVEVTIGSAGWHVHCHIACHSRYMSVTTLAQKWEKASGGYIVHIRNCEGSPAKELAKYMSKPPDMPSAHIPEVSKGLKGVRLFQPFGSWYKVEIDIPREPVPCDCCGKTGMLTWTQTVDWAYHRQQGPP